MLSPKQRKAAKRDPLSFRNALGRGAGASHADAIAWIDKCLDHGAIRSIDHSIIVYRQGVGDTAVAGIVADVSLDAYNAGLVKRHEKTIAKTQRKMANYMRTTRVYGNPIALTHRPHPDIRAAIDATTRQEAAAEFTTADGVPHQLWFIEGAEADRLCTSFSETLYITDGHHRLAAASLVASEEGHGTAYMPAGLFSSEDLTRRSFARCITDSTLDTAAVISTLQSAHILEEVSEVEARPRQPREFGLRVSNRFFRLRIDPALSGDGITESLDVSLLQRMVLEPVFGILDPTRDKRLGFVADLSESHQPDTSSDAWILPFPVDIADVMGVADAGQVMPPKSTWLAPKVPNGLVIRS